jgi:hypothetical protein
VGRSGGARIVLRAPSPADESCSNQLAAAWLQAAAQAAKDHRGGRDHPGGELIDQPRELPELPLR